MKWDKLKGKFIVLDGVDGSGKSSQLRLLAEYLLEMGVELIRVRDPGETKIGEQIREVLLDKNNKEMSVRTEVLLYMASRSQLYSEVIDPALKQGKLVLGDRWISSTYAYQAVAGSLGAEIVLKLAEFSLERVWPDLSIIIDLPSKVGMERIGNSRRRNGKADDPNQLNFSWVKDIDRLEKKSPNYHKKVRKAFLKLAESREDFRVVDGSGSIAGVQQAIREVVEDYVNS